ncbi:unnamed protein product [Anisakis simplex]|uniref:Saposin B-type domain-containing protein n=1 Tax=Anisakis simplex TaxID=6269 RepID=A0A0M3JRW6_ANISI|nr:unnamed protein product [Anisakis simplex]
MMVMKSVFLLIIFCVYSSVNGIIASANKQTMLDENRTPKRNNPLEVPSVKTTCDECKTLITKFAEAMKNPKKIAELKAILRFFCHETSYIEECKEFVDKLDYFIARLEPYLVCSFLLVYDLFHHFQCFAQKFSKCCSFQNDLICEECEFAATELKTLVDKKETADKVKKFLSENVCYYLKKYQGSCDLMLDQFIPELFEELSKLLSNPKQFCAEIGLCKKERILMENRNEKKVSVFSGFKL